MFGQLRANLRLSLRTIRNSKWRSMLTLTGVIVGVAAFIVIVAIGQGIESQVSNQINQLGKDLITVQTSSPTGLLDLNNRPTVAGSLTDDDVNTIAKVDGVAAVAPLSVIASEPKLNGQSFDNLVIATNQSLAEVINQSTDFGMFFDNSGEFNSAVIGTTVAQDMFKNPAPVGETFEFLGQNFVVSGVLNQIDTSPLSQKANFNNTIFIEYTTANKLLNGRVPIYEILARPTEPKNMNSTVKAINQALEKAHGQHDFEVLTQQQSIKATSSVLELITEMTVGVAIVALLVGGIGIMDIMLVSISERVSEIGLRKAVGASNRQILDQFVVEALVLSIIGAIVGTVVALVACYIIFIFSNIMPQISWQAIVVADAVALIVGLVFGTIPALKAARKDPIQALRHE